MPPIQFTKMHGLGNDYVYVSVFDQQLDDPAEFAVRVSDRHTGIGSDGLILLAPPTVPDADVRMEMYNADGSRAQMCGNGVRCLAKLAYERGIARRNPLRVQTDAGLRRLDLTRDHQNKVIEVGVDMGPPTLTPAEIPVALGGARVINHPVPIEGETLAITCVSMGNPHAIAFQSDLSRVPLTVWGPQIERHSLFPERTNVHFVQVVRRDLVGMITWERGSGVTRACGTGASAVCVAGVLNGVTDRKITARLPGGSLKLEWDEASDHVYMTGPAVEVFTGVMSV